MTPHYVLVYQITATDPGLAPFELAPRIILAIAATAFATLAVLLYFYFRKTDHSRRRLKPYLLVGCCALALALVPCLMIGLFGLRLANQGRRTVADAARALQIGAYSTAEGNVEAFDPMPVEGHKDECFSVQGKRFCYSDYIISLGFRNTTSHGGPIRAGLPVRIAFIPQSGRNAILRLEVRQP